ncbi:MAG: DUF2971 domain-containing protein [Acidobacteria bacterium]|nr:DUF2971 domain-containing protein [Acidobacteriota bacterium]
MTELFHRHVDGHRIYSLSKRWNNLSMWAKYADDHRGYCLEFANEDLFAFAREVNYIDGPVTLDITDQEQKNEHFFFCKTADWRNEEEARILFLKNSPPPKNFDPRLLTRIILGKDMAEDHRKRIREWARKRTPELEVVRAEYDQYYQKLILVESLH